jgi:hypothetical protein
MFKKLFYLISIVSLLVISAQVQAEVIFSDNFDHAMMDDWSRINYQGWYEQDVLGWPSPGGPERRIKDYKHKQRLVGYMELRPVPVQIGRR